MTKRNIILTGIVSILLIACIIPFFFSSPSPYREKRTSKVLVDSFLYRGHTMLRFTKGQGTMKHEINVCHSPECTKCKLFYD